MQPKFVPCGGLTLHCLLSVQETVAATRKAPAVSHNASISEVVGATFLLPHAEPLKCPWTTLPEQNSFNPKLVNALT